MYDINGVILDFREPLEIVSKDGFPKLKDFAIKYAWKCIRVRIHFLR